MTDATLLVANIAVTSSARIAASSPGPRLRPSRGNVTDGPDG